ncbi:patronin isoform X37 [Drosophila takahashii]|uniref:patronin isoform X37 n=1 Tax=Drosophila takahashii TaxID=29030 RepID=UPI003899148D
MDVETQEIRQARQRASVKWLLSKAFNNRVPDNLKEPFYRDHENQERLKPQIIVELGNATLYCQTLSNLYSDPNYQSMNHWSIIQTLARKGVPVAETSDMPITETVLIQTNPLRINAHMSVIESLMVLYAKEISSGDRVMAAIRRISGNNYQAPPGQSYEQALLGWISHACAALKKRIIKEVDAGLPDDNTPDIPPVRDFQDLCDGICLALLISYYCPKVVPWTSVRINYLPAVEDSIHNILLVCNFSQKHLPYSVFHMTPEDVTYMRGSMKLNLVLLLTDLFNLFEIHPAKCVCYPGMDGQGRRSRRNSSSEDSQLTIENFGGSQDQLNTLGRYERDRERKLSNTSVGGSGYPVEPAVAVRSSIADARGTLQLGYDTDSGSEKQDRETEKYSMRRQVSVDNVPTVSSHNLSNAGSPLPVARHKQHSSDKDYGSNSGVTMTPDTPYNDTRSTSGYDPESTPVRKSSTSSMPASPAAWQLDVGDDDMRSLENASKLSTIRMKLEEKRRRIEQDKRKIEMALLRHQEKEDLESCPDVMKWETMSNESKRTPDMDPVDLDKYQAYNAPVSAYSSRPPSRDPYQQQLHQQHQQQQPMAMPQYVNEHGQYMSPPQPAHYMQQQPQQQQQQQPQSIYSDNGAAYNNHSPYGGGAPQYRSSVVYDDYGQPTNHFYLHESSPQPQAHPHPQRRTWAHSAAAAAYEQQQQIQQPLVDVNAWQTQQHQQQKQKQTWMNRPPSSVGAPSPGSFVLHQNGGGNNGGGGELQHLFQVQASPQHAQRQVSGSNGVQRQQSLTNLRDNRSPRAPQQMGMPMQHEDMMAPQSICFIGDEEDVDELERNIIESMQSTRISDFVHQQQQQHQQQLQQQQQRLQGHSGRGSSSEDYDSGEMISNKLNITSGNLTYRIPSPSRPSIQANSFQDPRSPMAAASGEEPPEKGFYISFDDEQPKRPKPPLRAKRSPKKEAPPGGRDSVDNQATLKRESLSQLHNNNNIGFGGGEDVVSSKPVTRHSIHGLSNSNSVKSPGNATYNKYTDEPPIQLRQLAVSGAVSPTGNERRHLEDVTNQTHQQQQQQPMSPTRLQQSSNNAEAAKNKALVIGADSTNLDPDSVDEMERRKEKIMLLSLQRRQQQEEAKARKEIESSQKREKEREKEEERSRKKEEQIARRAAILEQHRLKKAIEEAEREGKTLDRPDLHVKLQPHSSTSTTPRLRQQRTTRPRPKTIHVDDASVDISEASSISSRGKKGSSSNLTGYGQLSSNSMKRDYYRGSQDSLTVKESPDDYPSTSSTPIGRRGSYKTSREPAGVERGRTLSRISVAKGSTLNFRGRKSNSLMNLCDSGLGRATPPRRAPSPGMGMGASGPKLYKQPAAKSNRGIILNAVEYCVFPGVVNREAKQKVLEKIARSEAKHFLVLFRDAGCQFRALYSYQPETDQVTKLYGTGPSQVDEVMFDKFFKYNSGGKCFSQVHTKHLTVTIDAFTIHNSLWQGKRVQLPSKKDMALVI